MARPDLTNQPITAPTLGVKLCRPLEAVLAIAPDRAASMRRKTTVEMAVPSVATAG